MVRVFINIIKNAVDAMPEGGTLQIRSTQTDGNVEISFADTGIGIPKENLQAFLAVGYDQGTGHGFRLSHLQTHIRRSSRQNHRPKP